MNPAATPHVLLTDDDPDLREMVSEYLGSHGMRVTAVPSGRAMFDVLDRDGVDLVLIDVKLPGEDGMQLLRTLRQRASLPIMMLTARADERDRVMGLDLGADDYVAKPFSNRELLARMHAVLRRYQVYTMLPERDPRRRGYRFAGWELTLATRQLKAPMGDVVELSNAEFNLLDALCRAPQRVLSRAQLLSMSRLHETEVHDRAVDVQILRLRAKLGADGQSARLIVTQRGVGYRFACEVVSLY